MATIEVRIWTPQGESQEPARRIGLVLQEMGYGGIMVTEMQPEIEGQVCVRIVAANARPGIRPSAGG